MIVRSALGAGLIGLITAVAWSAGVSEAELKLLFSVRTGDSNVDITRVAACGSGVAAAGHQAVSGALARGRQDSNPTSDIFVARLDELGHVLWTATLAGSASDSLGGLVCDADGNVLIAGSTQSFDLPVLAAYQPANPNASTRLANHSCGFFAKLDSGGQRRFSSYFCGEGSTGINAISLDTDGSILLAGSTNSLDFPTTPGAFIASPLRVPNATITYAFVSRFDPDGKRLLSSTLLGGTSPQCPSGGSSCLVNRGGSTAYAVLSDGAGGVLVAGPTSNADFPITEGAFQRSWSSFSSSAGFVSKLSRDGRSLLWSTYLSGDPQSPRPQNGSVVPQSLLIDAEGAVWVGGYTHHPDFPVTDGALQSSYHETRDKSGQLIRSGFLTAFQPDGRALKFSTYLGGEGGEVTSLAPGAGQAMWVTGLWEGKGFLLRFPDLVFLRLPEGTVGESVARAGDEVYVGGGSSARVLRLGAAGQTTPELLSIGNAAAAAPSGRVVVSEVISLYGLGLGPETPAVASLGDDGTLPTSLGGFRLFFDGVAAELLYADRRQVNAISPPAFFTDSETVLDVVRDDRIVLTRKLAVVPAEVEIFSGSVLNEDGTLNSKDNPAKPGSTLTALITGNGDLPFQVTLAGRVTGVETAPVAGRALLRLLLRLPQGAAGNLPLQVTSGGSTSAVVSIFVR